MKKQIKKEKTTSQIETIATTAVSTVSSVASIATSYIPIYFVQNKKVEEKKDLSIISKAAELYDIELLPKSKELIQIIQDYYSKGLLNYYSFDLHSKYQNYNKLLSDILNRISDTFSALIGFKKKEIAQKAYNARIASLKEVHDIYITEHESLLKSIQKNIDEINKVKPILKDYILTKLSKKLNSMGITSTISDYPMESIDFRTFLLKKEYDVINEKKLKIEEGAIELLDCIIPLPYLAFRNFKKAKELNDKIVNLKREEKLITEKIQSDLIRLEKLNMALNNIAQIFKTIKETFVPFLENRIIEIDQKYNNDYDQIPDNVLLALKSSSKILKEITEKKILKENFSEVHVKYVVNYSNKVTEKYSDLKETISKVA